MISSVIGSLRTTRNQLVNAIEGLSTEQLTTIPKGFNNNILWNFGHIIVSQQLLCYAKANVPLQIPSALVDSFKKASSPADWKSPIDVETLKALALSTVDAFEADLKAEKFNNYEAYMTSAGLELQNINDAIMYSYHHEGYHAGVIFALKTIL